MQTAGNTGDADARRLVLLGASFRSVEPALRERLFLDETAAVRLADSLMRAGCVEAFVLPTCDRLEIYAGIDRPELEPALAASMAQILDLGPSALAPQTYRATGAAAVARLFAVAASLDSALPGETQVLGQVKAAHRRGRDAGAIGSLLEPLLQAAYACAKRVRRETELGRHPVSMVAAARNAAQRLHGDLARTSALLIGPGDMGLLIADALRAAGLVQLAVAHPAEARAAALARALGVQYRPWADLPAALAGADIAIAAIGVGRVVVTRAMVEAALVARRRRPILLLDASIPGDIEPAAGQPDDAFLYGMEDLDRLAQDGLSNRQEAADAARSIVAEAVESYCRNLAVRDAAPALARLRERFEAMRAEVLAAHGDDAGEATRRLVNRLLHDPALVLRRLAESGQTVEAEHWLGRLFGAVPGGAGENGDDGSGDGKEDS